MLVYSGKMITVELGSNYGKAINTLYVSITQKITL